MPIYEYQCDACGERSEVMQKISDPPLGECPKCGEKKVRKLVSAAAFRLKGSGWYETDFKDSKRKNVAGGDGDKAGEKSGAKADEKKSESKSETKSEPAAAAAGE